MSARFLLFRHGLATRSLEGYGNQILTAALLPEGIPAIEKLSAFLKEIPSEVNFVSPVLRCQQTAEIVTKITQKKFINDIRLTEFRGENPDETIIDLRNRCQSFLDDVDQDSDKTILVCSHGGIIAALSYLIRTGEFAEANLYDYPPTGELWIIRNQKIEAFDFNSLG